MSEQGGLWAAGEAYEPYVGRWSRLVAPEFIRWLDPPHAKDWVDVGCGTGELTKAILATAAPRSVRGADPSEAFLAYATNTVRDDRVTFASGDAQHLPFEDASADYVVSGLVLNFADDPAAAVVECARVTRPGGTVAAYVWDYAGEMQMMRYFWDAAVGRSILRRAGVRRSRSLSDLQPERAARSVLGRGARAACEPRAIDVPTVFADFDDYWTPFLAGGAPAPRYAMSLSRLPARRAA